MVKFILGGRNDEGQIGNVNVASRTNEPMNVMAGATNSEDEESSLENIVAIAIGANHMTALRLDGKVYSWGTDMLGQLGDGRNGYEYEKSRFAGSYRYSCKQLTNNGS